MGGMIGVHGSDRSGLFPFASPRPPTSLLRRRDLSALLGLAVAAAPVAARAQPTPLPVVGVLMLGGPDEAETSLRLKAFRESLAERGWIDGRSVRLDVRWAANSEATLGLQAAALVAARPAVILANGTPAALALKKTATAIPVVCALVQDPVRLGLAASLARPGGTLTGFTFINPEIIVKWRQLLVEAAPATRRIGLLFNPRLNPQYVDYARDIARPGDSAIDVVATPVESPSALRFAVEELGRATGSALMIAADSFVSSHSPEIAALALAHRLPTVSVYRPFVDRGGLMSYGPDVADIFRRSASYVARILKGDSPADLPLQEPDKFHLAVNLGTARALGHDLPATLVARADEVIE